MTYANFLLQVRNSIAGQSSLLSDSELALAIANGLPIISKDFPFVKDVTITGTNSNQYALPVTWINKFSKIVAVEYPISQSLVNYLNIDEYIIYSSNNVDYLRLIYNTISSTESFKLYFTIPYACDNSSITIPDSLLMAFTNLVSFFACLNLLSKESNKQNVTINVDLNDMSNTFNKLDKLASYFLQSYHSYVSNKTLFNPSGLVLPAMETSSDKALGFNPNLFH